MDNLDLELERVIIPQGAKDHSQLQNLDYENSGHRGFASTEQLNATNERVSTLEEQVQTNASAIQALSEGIDPEKIDGLKEVAEYVNEHVEEVIDINERLTALEEKPSTPSGEPIIAMIGINSENTIITIKNISNAVLIDWGDGTPIEDISSKTEYTHTYTSIAVVYVKIYGGNGQMDIGDYAFYNLSTLYRIIIPQFTSISGEYAFYGCGLAEISLPSVLTKIGRNCFANCTNLTYIKIPKNVSTIMALAFSGCSNLKLVEMENTQPSSRSSNSFPSTTKFIVPYEALEQYKSNASWSAYASQIDSYALVSELPEEGGSATPSGEPLIATFNITTANTSVTVKNLTGATMVDWGDGSEIEDISSTTTYTHTYAQAGTFDARFYGNIKGVGERAFYNQQALYRIVFPDTITYLGASVCQSCRGLVYAKLPIGIENIPDYTFDYCKALLEIKMPLKVTAIGTRAFGYVHSGLHVKIVAPDNHTITWSSYPFAESALVLELNAYPYSVSDTIGITSGTKIIVPKQYLDTYKTAIGWSKYASQIDCEITANDIYALVGDINTQLANIIEGEGV